MFSLWGHDHLVVVSAMSNMAGSLCLCCDLAFVPEPGAALRLVAKKKKKKGRGDLRITVRAYPS